MARLFVKGPIVVQNGLMVGPNKRDAISVIDENGNLNQPVLIDVMSGVSMVYGMISPRMEVVCEEAVNAGDLLSVSGAVNGKLSVVKADASTVPKPAFMVAAEGAAASGTIFAAGVYHATNINTNACAKGAVVYLSATTTGSFVSQAPADPGSLVQVVGVCLVKDDTDGEALLFPFYQQGAVLTS